MVGGFSESRLLQQRMRAEFERPDGPRVVVPLRPGLAVVKGAVLLGLGAWARFASRVARFTYGVDCSYEYNKSDPNHRGREMCLRLEEGVWVTRVSGGFSVIVRQGTKIVPGQVHKGQTMSIADENEDNLPTTFCLYAAKTPHARFLADGDVELIGRFAMPQWKLRDRARLDLSFGRTEIRGVVINETTGVRTPGTVGYAFPS
jgi:hypothetical protein